MRQQHAGAPGELLRGQSAGSRGHGVGICLSAEEAVTAPQLSGNGKMAECYILTRGRKKDNTANMLLWNL